MRIPAITVRHEREEPYPWMRRAACAGIRDFVDRPVDEQLAYCARCDVKSECALLALKTITYTKDAQDVGMAWGGMHPTELAQLVRQSRRVA
jgi:hypothetical protein